MKYIKYKLDFPAGYHVSNFRLYDSNIKITADVLFSALVHEANNFGGSEYVNRLLEVFNEDKLLISDLFPYYEDELFIPKPKHLTKKELEDPVYKKELNKLKYIPISGLAAWLSGNLDVIKIHEYIEQNERLLGKHRLTTNISYEETGEHKIYNIGSYKFSQVTDSGLYFILGYKEVDDLFFFDDLMYSLSFSGLGGKRSAGLGRFTFTYDDLDKNYESFINRKANLNILLTSSIPRKDEIKEVLKYSSSYELIRKGGFIKSGPTTKNNENIRKKDIYFFDSGSTFEKIYNGDIYRVDNSYIHPVYRYGKSFFIGVMER